MHQKATLFNDSDLAAKILATSDPVLVKRLGRKVKTFDSGSWNEVRERIVGEGCDLKFSDLVLRTQLMETGNRELVEASPADRTWGIGYGAKKAPSVRDNWGKNLLGIALMAARERIREEEANAK